MEGVDTGAVMAQVQQWPTEEVVEGAEVVRKTLSDDLFVLLEVVAVAAVDGLKAVAAVVGSSVIAAVAGKKYFLLKQSIDKF